MAYISPKIIIACPPPLPINIHSVQFGWNRINTGGIRETDRQESKQLCSPMVTTVFFLKFCLNQMKTREIVFFNNYGPINGPVLRKISMCLKIVIFGTSLKWIACTPPPPPNTNVKYDWNWMKTEGRSSILKVLHWMSDVDRDTKIWKL